MPETMIGKLAEFGLDVVSITMLSILTVTLVELVKKHVGVTGSKLLLISLASALVWSALFYFPAWKTVLAATLIVTIAASGGWQGFKTLAGKVGEDNIKPMGEMDRGPSKPQ